MLRAIGKGSLILLCTGAGLVGGYAVYLFSGLVLLMVYGDYGEAGHPGKFLIYIWLFGSFGTFGIAGLFVGLKLSSRMFKSNERLTEPERHG
jgi:hypothetical protein